MNTSNPSETLNTPKTLTPRPVDPERFPLSAAFRQLRSERLADELATAGSLVTIIDVDDPLTSDPDGHQGEVMERVNTGTEAALDFLGFGHDHPLPKIKDVKRHARDGDFAPISTPIVGVSEFARRWVTEQAHEALGLAPIYDPDYFVAHKLTGDGSVPALFSAERGRIEVLPVDANDPARAHWMHHPDPVEVRKRGRWTQQQLVTPFLDTRRYPPNTTVRIAGLACGAAQPDMDAALRLSNIRDDLNIEVDLIDYDASALALAELEAGRRGFKPGTATPPVDVEAEVVSVLRQGRITLRLVLANILDEPALAWCAGPNGYDAVEAMGTVDYTNMDPDHPLFAGKLLSNMYRLAKDGGMVLSGVMTASHDYVQILGVVGWSKINPMSIADYRSALDAGAPGSTSDGRTEMFVLSTMSYAFARTTKPF